MTPTPTLNELLAPYEARPVTRSRADIARFQHSVRIGKELNRLQGYDGAPWSDRVHQIAILGQASKDELRTLLLTLVRQHSSPNETLSHER